MDHWSEKTVSNHETEVTPNRLVARALLGVLAVMLIVYILVEAGVYNAIDKTTMRVCMAISVLASVFPEITAFFPGKAEKPSAKYLIMADVILLFFVIAVVFNIYVELALVFPMLLASRYYNRHITMMAAVGSLATAVLAPVAGFFLHTWSLTYLQGIIRVFFGVNMTSGIAVSEPVWTALGEIFLYYSLPQVFILILFMLILQPIARLRSRLLSLGLRLQRMVRYDELTGLYTRTYFSMQAQQIIRTDPDETYLIVVTDVDNFKLYNDMFGHYSGDELLANLADSLRNYVGDAGICGRLSADHMVMLIRKSSFDREYFVKELLCAPELQNDHGFRVVVRAGVYTIGEETIPIDRMCDRAMIAGHSIRDDYRRLIVDYQDNMRTDAIRESLLLTELENAVTQNQFETYLQPQVDAKTEALRGAEVLVRWSHPQKGLLPPSEFIRECEESGLISRVDYVVWEKACALLSDWIKQGKTDTYLSVNISPRDLDRLDVYTVISELAAKYNIPPRNLNLELTESAIIHNEQSVLQLIDRFHEAGFKVEMDDFGSGYSSLGMLKDIPVDALKLDMSFLRESERSQRTRTILISMLQLAGSLNIEVIAEGVETKEQADFLRANGCDIFQGFYYSRPIPAEEYEKKYLKIQSSQGEL